MFKTVLDNTAFHRVSEVLDQRPHDAPISAVEANSFLHLAEHIMFAESIHYSTFELEHIRRKTESVIERLTERDVFDSLSPIIFPLDFQTDEYRLSCEMAVDGIASDLGVLTPKILKKWNKDSGGSKRPLGIRGSQIAKWITEEWPQSRRNETAQQALDHKAAGSFDYILATSDLIYDQLKLLTKNVKKESDAVQIGTLIEVFFRTNTNEQLAQTINGIYSPAVQRAVSIHRSDQLFRFEIEKRIMNDINDHDATIASKFIDDVLRLENVPLPMFAIHFLRLERPKSLLDMLRAALELRTTNSDLQNLRHWLSKWEQRYHDKSNSEKEKAQNELLQIAADLGIARRAVRLRSILRPTLSFNPDSTIDITPELSGFADVMRKLFLRFHRPKAFLSVVRKEIEFEENLGGEVLSMLNQPVVRDKA